ncbi:RDD family protein [Aeromicrobium sp. IC_218]|uniref:RDD family protein n=1 Tax=Aeromicrobium sp. IC_218 TaxID=2545468 RepID=UPI00103E054E|nr:RDD family protein [Aeromicrobium sp. IC_218]TCI99790.1 RDD family protein [Aeromicrobium sp. IC_218]
MTDGPQYPSYPGDPQQPGQTPPPQQGGYPQQPGPQQPGTYPQGYGQQPYQPAPPPQGYGYPAHPYAGWWSRVGAVILDSLVTLAVMLVPLVIGLIILFSTAETQTRLDGTEEITDAGNPLGVILIVLSFVVAFAFTIWNSIVRPGRTGQSLGKQWLGIKIVRENDGQPIGVGMSFLRYIMYSIFVNACFLDVLWPLWDARKRTWHDMVVSSVVVRA